MAIMPPERQGLCMTNQNGGQSGEAEFKPGGATANLSRRSRAAPVIEGEAVAITADGAQSTSEAAKQWEEPTGVVAEEAAASEIPPIAAEASVEPIEPRPSEEAPTNAAPPSAEPRKVSVFAPLATLVGVLVLGGGGYYAWQQMHQPMVGSSAAPEIAAIPEQKTVPAAPSPAPSAPETAPAAINKESTR